MTGAPRSAYTGGEFIAVRLEVVDAVGSWEAAGVWHRICWRAERDGHWQTNVEQLAAECRLSVHKTRRALDELRAAGWITAERASGRDRTLLWIPVWDDEQPSEENPDYVVPETGIRNPENQRMVIPKNGTTPSSKTVETVQTSPVAGAPGAEEQQLPILVAVPSPPAADPLADEFAGFWQAWPDKRNRKAAEKAYRAARRRGVPMEAIAAGVRAHRPVFEAKIRVGDGAYVPHAATWLNQERWTDPPPRGPRVNADAEALRRMMAGEPEPEASPVVQQALAMMGLPATPTRQELTR